MTFPTILRHGANITRAEWARHDREFGTPLTGRPLLLAILVTIGAVLGWYAHALGQSLASGQSLPYDRLGVFASVVFLLMAWRSSDFTRSRFERLNPEFLLTTVPARAAVVGLLGFVYLRLIATLAVPTVGIAVGIAVGLQSPMVAPSVLVAVASMTGLAVGVGTVSRLLVRLVAVRLARARFYRDLFVVFGWIPLMVGAIVLDELSISLTPLFEGFAAVPLAWFVDLALVGGSTGGLVSSYRAAGILVVLILVLPGFALGASVIARRVWESDTASSAGSRGSHSLRERGIVERFVGDRISRPVYTVARARWLMERRVPQGLLSSGYALLFMGIIGFPLIALAGGTTAVLLFFAVTLGLVAGIAFSANPIGTEYRTLQMLFTSVRGNQFVAGILLAATVIAIPLVALVTIPLGFFGPVGVGQTLLTALVGMSIAPCTASVAVATGLSVDRYDYAPVPFFFTDIPVYTEHGFRGLLRIGLILAVGLLTSILAFIGNAPPIYERLAAIGVPAGLVQSGSLVLTLLVVAVVTKLAFRIAVDRFTEYQFK